MKLQPRKLSHQLLASLFTIVISMAGCGSPAAQNTAMAPAELLDLLEEQQRRHDPKHYVELPLGKFRVSHATSDGYLMASFELFAVLPEDAQEEFTASLPAYEKRIRDSVIGLVQRVETEQLADPGLAYLKSEMVIAINRVLQKRLLKDVAFSTFSLERS